MAASVNTNRAVCDGIKYQSMSLQYDSTASSVVLLHTVCNIDILVEWRRVYVYVESSFTSRSHLMVYVNNVIT